MKITLKNIGLVESAEVNIGGLTVITGHNSVGKSFIGKAIYSAVKAISGIPSVEDDIEFKRLQKAYTNLYLALFNGSLSKEFSRSIQEKIEEKLSNHNPVINTGQVEANIDFAYFALSRIIEDLNNIDPQIIEVPQIKTLLKEFNGYKANPMLIKNSSVLDSIINLEVNSVQFKTLNIKSTTYDYLIKTIFKSEFNLKSKPNTIASININNGDKNQDLIKIKVKNNQTQEFLIKSHLLIKNVTYIETPIILSLVGYIRDNLAFSKKSSNLLPEYNLDLVQKLVEGSYDIPTDNPLYNSIIKTINGQLAVDNNQVVYKDEAKNSYNINNVASGIKSFGIIQLLLAGGSINPNSILIIDEPEVHLHPEWQLEYAKLLVELVKNNIPVIVTSHSPYFVEALKVYSDKAKISDKTHFYLGEMGKKGSTFKDVSQNLDLLFEKFSAPMLKLIIEK